MLVRRSLGSIFFTITGRKHAEVAFHMLISSLKTLFFLFFEELSMAERAAL